MSCFNVQIPTVTVTTDSISIPIPPIPIPCFNIHAQIPNPPPLPPIPGLGIKLCPAPPLMVGGGIPCCNFQVVIPYLDKLVSGINAALALALLPLAATTAIITNTMNVYIGQANQQLMMIKTAIPPCSLNAVVDTGT